MPSVERTEPPLVVGGVALDIVMRRVMIDGFVVRLPAGEARLLEALMRTPGRVLSLAELQRTGGAATIAHARRLARRLRRRLTVSPLIPPLIEAVGTTGVRFTLIGAAS